MTAVAEPAKPICSEDQKLEPGAQLQIKYSFSVPSNCSDPISIFKLHLVDPVKFERFGDAMTGICTIKNGPDSAQDENKSAFEERPTV